MVPNNSHPIPSTPSHMDCHNGNSRCHTHPLPTTPHNENTTLSEWELISIHALPEGVDNMPMGPITMMRNQLELKGGTKAHYSSDEWAKSIEFWQKYASIEPTSS